MPRVSPARETRLRTRAEKLRALRPGAPSRTAVSRASRLVDDGDSEVRTRALEILRDQGGSANARLAHEALEDESDVVTATAIECLVQWGVKRSADRVARLLESPSELTRSYAAWALGELGGPRHLPRLRQRLRVVRREIEGRAVAESLYKLTGHRRYLTHLLEQLRSRDPEVRAFTSNSLVGVVDARTFPEILCVFAHALARERSAVVLRALRRDIEIALAIALDETAPRGNEASTARGGRRT